MKFSCLMIALLVFSCKYARAIDNDEEVEDPDGIHVDNKERIKDGITLTTTATSIEAFKVQKNMLKGASKAISPLISGIGKIAPFLGVAGGVLTLLLAFIPKEDSDELKLMKKQFSEVNRKLDTINGKLDNFETLIIFQTQRTSFIKLEHNILNGFEMMEDFYQELYDTKCIKSENCQIVRKKKGVALKYLDAFQKVDPSLRSILRASINEDTFFGEPLLDLLKNTFQCEVGKLTEFVEIVVLLASKGQQVKTVTEKLTGSSVSSAQSVKRHLKSVYDLRNYYYTKKNECFENRDHYYSKDIKDRKYQFFNHQDASKALSVSLEKKYPWLLWNVVSYKANHYKTGERDKPKDLHDYLASDWSVNFPSDKQTKRYFFAAPVDPEGDYTVERRKKVIDTINDMKNEKLIYNCFNDKWGCVSKIRDRLEGAGNYFESIIVMKEDMNPPFILYAEKVNSYINEIFEFQSTWYKYESRTEYKYYPIKVRVVVMLKSVEMDNPDKCTKNCDLDHSKCERLPFSKISECQCKTNFDGEECREDTQAGLVSSLETMTDVTLKMPNLVDIYYNLEDLKKETNEMGQILKALKYKSGTKTKKKLKKN